MAQNIPEYLHIYSMYLQLTQPIDTIIFDLGGVLIDWNPRYLYRKIFVDQGAMDFFLKKICHADWNHQQDAGRPWEEAMRERIEKFPEYEPEIRAYFERWEEMLGGVVEDSLRMLDILYRSNEHRLFALTNWSAETWPIARKQFEFLDWFEGIVVSGYEQLAKPDEAIYRLTCERYDIEPSKTLFIDDSEANVISAQRFGLNAIQFESPMQIRQTLTEWL